MDPATLPVSDGANTTLSAAVCPGANVVFAPAPLTLNPAPVTTTLEIVMLAFPEFFNTIPSELLLPTSTLPKSRLFALELSNRDDATALPLVEIASGELGALLLKEIEPVTFPAALGANTTLNVAFLPAAMLIGSVRPDVLKPAPVTLALEIVTLAVPAFCNVIVWELFEPVATAGKLALVGVAERDCACGVGAGVPLPPAFDPLTTPAHPLPIIETASSTIVTKQFDILLTSDLWFFIVW
jgi:hypothetical protein